MYDNYESNFDEEQHCVEINHPEFVEDIEQPYLQFSRPAFIMFHTGFAKNIKQPMISKKINLQPCLDLQVAESGSHYEEEDIQRYFDLQQEVFPYSFIDPFVDYITIIWRLYAAYMSDCFCQREVGFSLLLK